VGKNVIAHANARAAPGSNDLIALDMMTSA